MHSTRELVMSTSRWFTAAISGGLIVLGQTAYGGSGQPTVLAWNNLGMHCMDDDYSIFTILPPYNTLNAQVIDATGHLVATAGRFTVTYDSIADPEGSINASSTGKSNFWTFAPALFNATLAPNQGLAGFAMPGVDGAPQPLTFTATMAWYEATGIPITPWDDAGRYRPYPVVRVVATDTAAGTRVEAAAVLPVSEEMDCRKCHGSSAGAAARPSAGWINDPVPTRDYRLNILQLHDELNDGQPLYTQALAAAGISDQGLYDQVVRVGRPILCAACHASEALAAGGVTGVSSLTRAVHHRHAAVIAPDTRLALDATTNRSACYQCHPGSATRCLRGAMGSAVATDGSAALQCQSCHGSMNHVGAANRTGWLDEPNCQSCHTGTATNNNGAIRYLTSLEADGSLRQPVNLTFATNANTPAAGKSLYRFSRGHGGIACAGCHGSTHAEYPSLHANDNLASLAAQGHIGVISTCTACHPTMPNTVTGGPHGLHPVGQSWVSQHGDAAEHNASGCRDCHGTDYRGTVLSRAMGDRQFSTEWGTRSFWRGQQISCYECHNGPQSESRTSYTAPSVPTMLNFGSTPRTVALAATVALSPATGVTLRVVRQAEHGTVAVSGAQLTYQPDSGYVGPDTFTYAATNGVRESNLGTAHVTVELGDPGASPAGDGLSNQLKYALGLDPTRFVATGLPVLQVENFGAEQFLTLTAVRNPLAADEPLRVEGSDDGLAWTALTDPALVLNDQPWLFKIRDAISTTANHPRTLRLSAGSTPLPGWSSPPQNHAAALDGSVALSAVPTGSAVSCQWMKNGVALAGATNSTLTLARVQPADAGLYAMSAANPAGMVVSTMEILGLTTDLKVIGTGREVLSNTYVEANHNTFDQLLLEGPAATITADRALGQITRISFIDLTDDIVQVELSGAGSLSLVLADPSGPAAPVNYHQAVDYMKGHAGIVIVGADETSNVSVFSVGRHTAVNQALFKDGVAYDGLANLAFIAIASPTGKFGGVRTGNVHYFAAQGFTGLYAPGVEFSGPIYLGDITAFDLATPGIVLGASSADNRITGGSLAQDNHRAVQVKGLTQLRFTDGMDSHGNLLPARANSGVLQQDGVDVTTQIVVAPGS